MKKRDYAMTYAREYARAKNVLMVQAWIDRAALSYPLTDMQVWLLQKLLGPLRFNQLDFSKIRIVDAAELRRNPQLPPS